MEQGYLNDRTMNSEMYPEFNCACFLHPPHPMMLQKFPVLAVSAFALPPSKPILKRSTVVTLLKAKTDQHFDAESFNGFPAIRQKTATSS